MSAARRIAERIVRHRRAIVICWIGLSIALLPAGRRLQSVLDVSARVPGSESALVDSLMAHEVRSPFAHYAVLVARGIGSPAEPEGAAILRSIIDSLRATPGVGGTFSWLDLPDTLLLGLDGTFVIVGLTPGPRGTDAMIPVLRARTEAVARQLRLGRGATLRWTGESALNHDLRITSASEARRAELRVLPLTAVLLIVAFGAVAAAVLPVVAGALAIAVTMGFTALLAEHWSLSILLETIVTMIGLGVGIDYALLLVGRFREALARGGAPEAAAIEAVEHAGRTIGVSGLAVAIGFVALLRVPLNELRSVAVGGAIVVVVAVLVATTLLPAVLVALGSRVNMGRWHRAGAMGQPSDRWRRWGRLVTRYPAAALIIAGAPVVALVSAAPRIDTNLPRGDWLPPAMESARGLRDLETMGRAGVVHALRILVRLPPGAPATGDTAWQAFRRLELALLRDRRVARVRSLAAVVGGERPNPIRLGLMPASVRRTLVSPDERLAVIEVVPRSGVDYLDVTTLAREIRADGAHWLDLPGAALLVGGMPAFNADYQSAVDGTFGELLLLVIGGTLVALCIAFRSILLPLKAVALNLLSVGAALGAVVLVFQDGHLAALVGLAAPVTGVFAAVPSLVFCIVFGLSMDYEVFLLDRVTEARRSGREDSEAIAEGLAHTGRTITSAAAIMIAVFAAFIVGDFITVKILGFALAVAVLLDATLVRVAIGPALLRLAGRWNWWPGERVGVRRPSAGVPRPPRPDFTPRAGEI